MPIRVLIADDMQTSYVLLRSILLQAGGFEIIGWAQDGEEVVRLTADLRPDIVTMDIEMPKQSGLDAIREIMASTPVPIVVVSSYASDTRMNLAFNALREGALDVMDKPPSLGDPSFPSYAETLATKLLALAEVKLVRRRAVVAKKEKAVPSRPNCSGDTRGVELVALGASAGGPKALLSILTQLPQNYPYPIVIVQHIVEGFMTGMAGWLDMQCALRVKVAENDEPLLPGTVYFAPDGHHLLIVRGNPGLVALLNDDAPMGGFKPSINRLMESVAATCGGNAIGGILTGMGSDGAAGLLTLAQKGSATFAQDEETSLIFGMPKVALELGAARQSLALEQISGFLCATGDRRQVRVIPLHPPR